MTYPVSGVVFTAVCLPWKHFEAILVSCNFRVSLAINLKHCLKFEQVPANAIDRVWAACGLAIGHTLHIPWGEECNCTPSKEGRSGTL